MYLMYLYIIYMSLSIHDNYELPETNIDTKNDGFKNVSPFKYGYFGYSWVSMLVFGGVHSLKLTDK